MLIYYKQNCNYHEEIVGNMIYHNCKKKPAIIMIKLSVEKYLDEQNILIEI